MMKTAVLLFLTAIHAPLLAQADVSAEFDERVRIAKEAESDERFHPYPSLMYQHARRYLARAMRQCKAVSPKASGSSFVVVADIDRHGRTERVEVKPASPAARCFAARFSSAIYLEPPAYPGRAGFPVTMKIGTVR